MPHRVCKILHSDSFFNKNNNNLVFHRGGRFMILINGSWGKNPADATPEMRTKVIAWARKLYTTLAAFPEAIGGYILDGTEDDKEKKLLHHYGANLARLRSAKKKYGEIFFFSPFFLPHFVLLQTRAIF